ncbi:hypothetical protein CRG98_034683 [Punica granatum]|uniref:Uncharacterized protein n=1 Tax=Punica granatum TaxID=22663 RepID=A0A2I0ILP7_PUNGR|nr:hypothetical protein CRG98_034683 [Punica granatum]
MHVRGARCTGSAAGMHGRRVRYAGARAGARTCRRARGARGRARGARACAGRAGPAQPIYYLAPPAPLPPTASQPVVHHYTPALPQAQRYRHTTPRVPQPAQWVPAPQTQQNGKGQTGLRPLYPSLPIPQSQVYRQLLGAGKIFPETLRLKFNSATQDQSLRCEFHMGAPRHTTNNCYVLRGKLQDMVKKNLLSFKEIKPPNVQNNHLPNHRSSSNPAVNVIDVHTSGKDKDEEDEPASS